MPGKLRARCSPDTVSGAMALRNPPLSTQLPVLVLVPAASARRATSAW